jgi:hypothetical protein
MTVAIRELMQSRELTDAQAHERLYLITGTDDEATALATLKATAPATSNSLVRGNCQVVPLGPHPDGAGGFLRPGAWNGLAPYASVSRKADTVADDLDEGDISVTYSTGGASQHVTQSLATVDSGAIGAATPTDHKGAIGVTDDGVEGVDIGVRQMRLTITKAYDIDDLPAASDLYALTFTVNDDTVAFADSRTGENFSFAAGELLLEAVDGPRMRRDGLAELTYTVLAAPNVTGIGVGDIAGLDKAGHEYLWARYEKSKDAGAGRVATRPFEAYVEQVYEEGDFSALAL